jgi:hypothetical protein
MWLGHDLAWWGIVIASGSLILMFPVAIVANIVTPKLQNWWAQRSTSTLRARIEKLDMELADYVKNYELMSLTDDYILRGISILGAIGFLLIKFLTLVFGVLLIFSGHLGNSNDKLSFWEMLGPIVLILMIEVLTRLMKKSYFKKLVDYRGPRSPIYREYLSNSLSKLRSKLDKKASL